MDKDGIIEFWMVFRRFQDMWLGALSWLGHSASNGVIGIDFDEICEFPGFSWIFQDFRRFS